MVSIDYEPGIRQSVQHLAALGHRDIVFAAGAANDFTAELRRQLVRRGSLHSRWFRSRGELRTVYDHRDFHRELIIAVDRAGSPPQFANGRLVFIASIAPSTARAA